MNVDCGVRLGVAGIRNGDRLIFGAISREHVGNRADEFGTRPVAHGTQRPLALPARVGQGFRKIEPLGRGCRQFLARDGVDQLRLNALPGGPAAG